MRKLPIVAMALAGVVALGGVAYAANTYSVTRSSTTPGGKGSPGAPQAKRIRFDYAVGTDDGILAQPVLRYKIAIEGIKGYGGAFPRCSIRQAKNSRHATLCRRAKVGSGVVTNKFGAAGIPTSSASTCVLRLNLYNGGNGIQLRLDSAGAPPPGCPVTIADAIPARFRSTRVDRVPTGSLEFTVPNNLRHPAGLTNSVQLTQATVNRRRTRTRIRGRRRTVGFYSAIGCRGRTRTTRVEFTDESGARTTATRNSPC